MISGIELENFLKVGKAFIELVGFFVESCASKNVNKLINLLIRLKLIALT